MRKMNQKEQENAPRDDSSAATGLRTVVMDNTDGVRRKKTKRNEDEESDTNFPDQTETTSIGRRKQAATRIVGTAEFGNNSKNKIGEDSSLDKMEVDVSSAVPSNEITRNDTEIDIGKQIKTRKQEPLAASKSLPTMDLHFAELMESNYVYVDKTNYLAQLIRTRGKCFTLFRPRRFGKSCFLEMAECYFKSKKSLFENLDIWNASDLQYHFEQFPVLKFDFSPIKCTSVAELKVCLQEYLDEIAEENGITLKRTSVQMKFRELIKKVAMGKENEPKRVVILIDEYEAPFRSQAASGEGREDVFETMRSFYAVIKSLRVYVHFCLVMGISHVEMADVFSGFNHASLLNHVNEQYAAILGFTTDEIRNNFDSEVSKLSSELNVDSKLIYEHFKEWYNGFRFTRSELKVYNPCSVISYLGSKGQIRQFFSQSGGSSYFYEQILRNYDFSASLFSQVLLDSLETESEASESDKALIEVAEEALYAPMSLKPDDEMKWAIAFFQTGLLTIRDVFEENGERTYSLAFSNRENQSYYLNSLSLFTLNKYPGLASVAKNAQSAVKKENWKSFVECTNSFLAQFPHTLINVKKSTESVFQLLMYIFLKKMDYTVELEKQTLRGLIDLVATPRIKVGSNSILVFEFKIENNHTPALIQCEKYVARYLNLGRNVYCIAMQFSRESTEISKFGVARYQPNQSQGQNQNHTIDRIPYAKCDASMSWSWSSS